MAKVVGRDGKVKIGANTVAEVVSFTLDQSMTPVDSTALNTQELTYVAGDITRTAQVTCHWDKADTTGQGAISIGASVTLDLYPEGDGVGGLSQSMTALCTSVGQSNERGSMVSKTFGFQVTGTLTES